MALPARKLNQVIAVEKGIKAGANDAVTAFYHTVQKPNLFAGISRNYSPIKEDGQQLPSESTLVQQQVLKGLSGLATEFSKLFDIVATKETGNTTARGNIIVNGQTILGQVPVTVLLFLEKQLKDIRTVISKVPVLDPAESWQFNGVTKQYETASVKTIKTQKVPRNHVKAEATEKHPAQVELYYEDVPVGTWSTIKSSGAVPQSLVNTYLGRVDELLLAVKTAREEANSVAITDVHIGKPVFDFLFSE